MQHLDGAVLCDEVLQPLGGGQAEVEKVCGHTFPTLRKPLQPPLPVEFSPLPVAVIRAVVHPSNVLLPLWPECRSAQQTAWWPMGHTESKAADPRGRLRGLGKGITYLSIDYIYD